MHKQIAAKIRLERAQQKNKTAVRAILLLSAEEFDMSTGEMDRWLQYHFNVIWASQFFQQRTEFLELFEKYAEFIASQQDVL